VFAFASKAKATSKAKGSQGPATEKGQGLVLFAFVERQKLPEWKQWIYVKIK
jgi:hypothetical protein